MIKQYKTRVYQKWRIPFWIPVISRSPWGPASGGTPLHVAASNDQAEVVRLLLDSGADVKAGGGGELRWPLRFV